MNLKSLLSAILFCAVCFGAMAQTEFSVGEITIINVGDGRMLFRSRADGEPLQGERRIIDGRQTEYTQAHFKDGMYDGNYERHRRNVLVEKGVYKEGRRHGVFYQYNSDGSVSSERPFTDGKLDGVAKTFFMNGEVETKTEYTNGIEDGVEQKWDSDGVQTVDAFYIMGQPHGRHVRHKYTNMGGDYVEIINFDNGVRNGEFSQTWSNGQTRTQGVYTDGAQNGLWVEYRRDGTPERSVDYDNFETKAFYSDGTVERISTLNPENGNGTRREYYQGSETLKSEYNYTDNFTVIQGLYKLYYDDGSLREEGRYDRGGTHVYRKEFFRNGNVRQVREINSRGQWETIESYNEDGTQR